MNNRLFLFLPLYLLLITAGCKKDNPYEIINDQQATVEMVRYACGPACDAFAYAIRTSQNDLFTPLQLGVDFQVHQLNVKIRFKRTGKYRQTFTGPPYELVEIVDISR